MPRFPTTPRISAILCLPLLFLATPALAETDCIAPTAPTLPAVFDNLAAAEATETDVQAYLMASGQYQQCLAGEWDALGDERTTAQEAEITALRSAARDEAVALAEAYNAKVIALHSDG